MSERPTKSEAKKLLHQFGSPLFIIYKDSLLKNISLYKDNFKSYSGGFTLSYSVKTNNNPAILKIFRDQQVQAEVCSRSDIVAAKLAGYKGKETFFDGLIKTSSDLELAIKDNFSLINIESLGEAMRLATLASKLKKNVNVGIRLSFPSSRVGLKSLLGITYDRFGVSRKEAERLADFITSQKHLRLVGLHCHTGSNQKSSAHYLIGINELISFMQFLKKRFNLDINILNLGGGFGVPEITAYRVFDLGLNALNRLLDRTVEFSHRPFNFAQTASEIILYLEKKLDESHLSHPRLVLEPGRSLVGNTTHLLTSILDTKKTENHNWMIIDAGTNLMPVLTFYSEYHDIIVFSKSRQKKKISIAGPLLYSSDSLVSDRVLPSGQDGDVVMICDTGAYFNCQANQFLYPRAASVLIENNTNHLIERRETAEDLFNRIV